MDNKIQLNFIHICDNAFLSQEGKMNIIGIFDVFGIKKNEEAKDVVFNFYIVTNILAKEAGEYELKIILDSKDGETVLVDSKTNYKAIKGKKYGHIVRASTKFPNLGDYKVDVFINDQLFATLPLIVANLDSK